MKVASPQIELIEAQLNLLQAQVAQLKSQKPYKPCATGGRTVTLTVTLDIDQVSEIAWHEDGSATLNLNNDSDLHLNAKQTGLLKTALPELDDPDNWCSDAYAC